MSEELSEEELRDIERKCVERHCHHEGNFVKWALWRIPRLIAEIRRLRAENAELETENRELLTPPDEESLLSWCHDNVAGFDSESITFAELLAKFVELRTFCNRLRAENAERRVVR